MRRLKNSPKIYLVTQSHQEIWNTSHPFGMFTYWKERLNKIAFKTSGKIQETVRWR